MAGVGLSELAKLGNSEGWGLCPGSVEHSPDAGGRGKAAAKATVSESPRRVLCVGVWRCLLTPQALEALDQLQKWECYGQRWPEL